jgi:acetylornithine deacetylase
VLQAGTEANIVPGLAQAEMMFRLVGPVDPIKARVLECCGAKAEVEFGSYIPAQLFHTVPGFESAPVAYTSDIPLLSRWGTPLLFGPGSINVAHTTDEFVEVNELRSSVDAYERLVKTLLAS